MSKEPEPKTTEPGKARRSPDQKSSDAHPLPFLVEASFTVSGMLTLLVSLTVMVVSFLYGVSLLELIIRTGVAILATGILCWLVTWRLINNSVDAILAEQSAEDNQAGELSAANSSVELKA